MFILEGADGSGKTTIGNHLRRTTQLELIHEGGPPKNSDEFRQRCQNQLASYGKILDRAAPISELVYGSLMRDKLPISEVEIWEYIESFIKNGWILIYCRPSLKILTDHVENQMDKDTKAQGKEYKSAAHSLQVKRKIKKIVFSYDKLICTIRDAGMPVLLHISRDKLSNFLRR